MGKRKSKETNTAARPQWGEGDLGNGHGHDHERHEAGYEAGSYPDDRKEGTGGADGNGYPGAGFEGGPYQGGPGYAKDTQDDKSGRTDRTASPPKGAGKRTKSDTRGDMKRE